MVESIYEGPNFNVQAQYDKRGEVISVLISDSNGRLVRSFVGDSAIGVYDAIIAKPYCTTVRKAVQS